MGRPGLNDYESKRNFSRTPEPLAGEGDPPVPTGDPPAPPVAFDRPLTFVVQKHAARRLHYDFRLEVDGVLKSWPIPKGPSFNPADKRLAVMTEDHPLDYASFEGVIPKGEYGGGQVIVWDAGVYAPEIDGEPYFKRAEAEERVRRGLEQGKLSFILQGRKLRGAWTLVRKGGNEWLFLKKDDAYADPSRDVLAEDASVLSGLTIEDLKAGRLPDRARARPLLLSPAELPGARQGRMPSSLPPMLPALTARPFSNPGWLFEPKLDGYRVISLVRDGQARLLSRRGLDATAQYPWLAKALGRQPYREAVLDGEIVAFDEQGRPSFQRLQNRASDPLVHLVYYIFDVIHLDGYDLQAVPLEHRKALLESLIIPSDRVRPVEHFAEQGEALYQAALANGMEGVVGKRRDSHYEAGRRSTAWLKVKSNLTDDFVVVGYTAGTGAREQTFGSLVLGSYDEAGKLTYVGQVGSGFDDRTLRDLLGRLRALHTDRPPFDSAIPKNGRWGRRPMGPITWVQPELVAEVKFLERTQDGILRAPVFLRLRDDKQPSEASPTELVAPPPTTNGNPDQPAEHGSYLRLSQQELDELLEQLADTRKKLVVTVQGQEIALTNLDKELWPKLGRRRALTKRDLLVYFVRVSPYLLPHLKDRPITLVRYPNGIREGHFYQKHWEHQLPPFVDTVRLFSDHRQGDGDYILCNNLPTLVWLGQIADLELHTWYSRISPEPDGHHLPTTFSGSLENIEASLLNYPDFMVFDLDPYLYSGKESAGAEPELHRKGFAQACRAALWLKDLLDGLSLSSFVKTTGKTGLHVYVPVFRQLDYDATHSLTKTVATFLKQQHPEEITIEWAVTKRIGKLFVDYNQNVRGKTLASIYSPRVLPEASVSMPLRWDELGDVFPTDFTILTAPERLGQVGDLWADILDAKHDLSGLLEATSAS